MNTSSKRALWALMALLALGACIQGPWDYYPENPPPFKGVFVTGYAIAEKPLRNLCFERILDLSEEATEAFPFYDSADVRVTGSFAGTDTTLALRAVIDTPNCFAGDPLALVKAGSAYSLEARLTWDSAGHKVTSVVTGTAHVPAAFKLHDRASAPSMAGTGGIPADPREIFTLDFLLKLPPDVRDVMLAEFKPVYDSLAGDSAALAAFIKVHGSAIQKQLTTLLQKSRLTYPRDTTLFYLNGAFNTLSHYFSCDRSADVQAVLITQRFDPDSARPETRFDSPFGNKPDSGRYYFPGDHRRLLIYPDAKGKDGYNLLDSMGVVNTWFHTGRNMFYFYGMEQAYMAFNRTATQVQGGGGPSDGDPRIKPQYNVKGGIGVFVGGVVDSFAVNIKVDGFTKAYSLPAVHAAFCREEGWTHDQDCRAYYRSYCSARDWAPGGGGECLDDALAACLEAELKGDSATQARCAAPADSARKLGGLIAVAGAQKYCIENAFPASGPDCSWARDLCVAAGQNGCKDELWDFCKDNLWNQALHPQCGPALVTYCKDKGRPSEIMCSRADDFCRENPGEAECK